VARPQYGIEKDEPLGQEAGTYCRRLCEGRIVRLELDGRELRDPYGRLLAYVQLPDGTWLNEQMLAAGLARNEDRFPHRQSQRYEALEKQARHDRVGIWRSPGSPDSPDSPDSPGPGLGTSVPSGSEDPAESR
jgi:micrococcal nuclease